MMTETQRVIVAVGAGLLSLGGVALLQGGGPATLAPFARSEPPPEYPALLRLKAGEPALTAEAALAKRLRSGEIFYERNADLRLPIASLTKLMTALLLAEKVGPLSFVEFSADAKGAGPPDAKRSAVRTGDHIKAEDVLKLLLVSSDGDAAYAAAAQVAAIKRPQAPFAERVARFVEMMNERAGTLGLSNTRFANPSGDDDPESFSSARDLAALAGVIAAEHPELFAASRIIETFIFGVSEARYGVVNTNPLLTEYPAIFGSKTGFDDDARGTLILLYQVAPGDAVAFVLLRSADRFADGRAFIQWLESSFVLGSQ